MANDRLQFKTGHAAICAALLIAIPFITRHEGTALKAYEDVAGIYTICNGAAHVAPDAVATSTECENLTRTLVGKTMEEVADLVPAVPPQTLAAYTSFAYNIGVGAFSRSSTRRLAANGDIPGSCEAMLKWHLVNGRDCRIRSNGCYGVWQRRIDERDLCLKGAA